MFIMCLCKPGTNVLSRRFIHSRSINGTETGRERRPYDPLGLGKEFSSLFKYVGEKKRVHDLDIFVTGVKVYCYGFVDLATCKDFKRLKGLVTILTVFVF